jgi:ribonuclease HI
MCHSLELFLKVYDEMGCMTRPIAYTDGACLGNPGPGGWGVRILFPDGSVQELGGAVGMTTNNRMELQAAIEALKAVGASAEATIFTDSRYVIDGLTKWIHNWRRRGWTTVANTPVKNHQLWMALDRLNHPGIRWQHVRGHSGEPNNERVDTIARLFAQGAQPQLFRGRQGAPLDPATVALPRQPTTTTSATTRQGADRRAVRYVSIVHGTIAIDDNWHSCASRVHGVSGAHYGKVHTPEELAAFCAKYGMLPPSDAWEGY